MDITDIVSTEYRTFDGDTPASKLLGAFEDQSQKAVVVVDDGEYLGVVTQRQLASAHVDPDEKARGLVWHVAKLSLDDDVRRVASLMLGSNAQLLPVFDDDELTGVVTADDLLRKVLPFLHVLSVDDVWSPQLVTIDPETSVGEVLHALREHTITHLPVVDDGTAVGVVSLFDLLGFTTREIGKSAGGSPSAPDTAGGRSHGGFGERAGDVERMLDLPARDVMSTPVVSVAQDERLDAAVETMFDNEVSSLVVTADGRPAGIVTKTDVLRSLTWTDETQFPVQIVGIDLLDDISRRAVSEMVEQTTRKFGDMRVLEANVYLHKHEEKLRGTPLLMARIRLFTDRGHFVGTGEGYGAAHALHLARNTLERQILEGKEYAQTKKHPADEELAKMYGWWMTGTSTTETSE